MTSRDIIADPAMQADMKLKPYFVAEDTPYISVKSTSKVTLRCNLNYDDGYELWDGICGAIKFVPGVSRVVLDIDVTNDGETKTYPYRRYDEFSVCRTPDYVLPIRDIIDIGDMLGKRGIAVNIYLDMPLGSATSVKEVRDIYHIIVQQEAIDWTAAENAKWL